MEREDNLWTFNSLDLPKYGIFVANSKAILHEKKLEMY
jgi:hypothetical protein